MKNTTTPNIQVRYRERTVSGCWKVDSIFFSFVASLLCVILSFLFSSSLALFTESLTIRLTIWNTIIYGKNRKLFIQLNEMLIAWWWYFCVNILWKRVCVNRVFAEKCEFYVHRFWVYKNCILNVCATGKSSDNKIHTSQPFLKSKPIFRSVLTTFLVDFD